MSKICTTIEQSKKLMELGIDVNTADMYWWYGGKVYYVEAMEDGDFNKESDIPCWSLSALLELIDNKAGIAKEYGTWFSYDNGKSHCGKHCDNPLDAVFEMVVWLLENKKL